MVASKHMCPQGHNIPILHSTREEINRVEQLHWFINYCPKHGVVTGVEHSNFNYSNLIPRIGKVKSAIFILLFGVPFIAIAFSGGGIFGVIMVLLVLGLIFLASMQKIYEVADSKYKVGEYYPELVRRK